MTDQPSPESISDLLRKITHQEDLDSCQVMANVINVYLDAIKRRGGRTELFADDINRILNIIRIMLAGGDVEFAPSQFIPKGRSLKGSPEKIDG